jgi:hypothetical protein
LTSRRITLLYAKNDELSTFFALISRTRALHRVAFSIHNLCVLTRHSRNTHDFVVQNYTVIVLGALCTLCTNYPKSAFMKRVACYQVAQSTRGACRSPPAVPGSTFSPLLSSALPFSAWKSILIRLRSVHKACETRFCNLSVAHSVFILIFKMPVSPRTASEYLHLVQKSDLDDQQPVLVRFAALTKFFTVKNWLYMHVWPWSQFILMLDLF